MNAPKCHACGAVVTNPAAGACAYCHAPFAQQQVAPYGQQVPPYGQQPYGQAPPPYGYPPQQGPGYGQVYGQPQQPYQVQPWAQPAFPPQQPWYNRWGGGGFWSTFMLIRLGIAFFILFIIGMGACVSALSH